MSIIDRFVKRKINQLFQENEALIELLCEKVSKNLPNKLFTTFQDGKWSPYLHRHYILRRSWLLDTDDEKGIEDLDSQPWWLRKIPGVYLHYFHRGDLDRELHNHPWDDSWSLILTNGYIEERGHGNSVLINKILPGSINRIKANDFHKVDLIDASKGCWTLFFSGPRVQDWGFRDWLDPEPPFVPWQEHVG